MRLQDDAQEMERSYSYLEADVRVILNFDLAPAVVCQVELPDITENIATITSVPWVPAFSMRQQ